LTRQTLANHRSAPNAVALVAFAFSLLALGACPGSLSFDYVPDGSSSGTGGTNGGADAGPIILSCDNAMTVLQNNCFGCHTNPPTPTFANLDLMSAGVAQRLVGQPASTNSAGVCGGLGNLLNPTTLPATGILIDKINFKTGVCGAGMPYGTASPIAAADLACLQAWANGLVNSLL
jgi:hypothetical protein